VAGDDPFVVLVGVHGADEADRGSVVREDSDDVGASFIRLPALAGPLSDDPRPADRDG